MEATSLDRYGVKDASQAPEVQARRAATNKERYGAENVFSEKSTLFSQVQASLEGKRPVLKGADNPFAQPEVQEKIRQHWEQEHGVSNPQQVPEVRARTKATNLERYGGELLGSPELRAKADATNLAKYGTTEPARTPEVKARIQETNLERYGVPWTSMVPEVRRKQLDAMEARYGAHYFASEEGKWVVRAALLEKYGVSFPGAIEGHWEKAVATFQERYGVDHPLQLIEFLEQRKITSLAVYGTEHPIQSFEVKQRMVDTKTRKYGNPWGPPPTGGPNGLERAVLSLMPSLVFTGDFSFWRWLPKLGNHKNPDFILPGPDPEHPKRGVKKVVEAFGDFWHSRMFTGRSNWEHEQELVEAYAEVGIECLIVWESEIKTDPEAVVARLVAFCGVACLPPVG